MTANPDISELAPLLRHWGIDASKPLELKAIPEGLSGANIWWVSHEEHQFCLRRWPSNHPAPDHLRNIHRVLEHVWQAGLRIVSVPYKTLQGDSFVPSDGHLWELSHWLPGESLSSCNSTPQQRMAAVEALAEFHLAAATFGSTECKLSPGLIKRRDLLAELLQGRLAELSQAVRNETPSPTRETLLQSLSRIEHVLPRAFATVEQCSKSPLPLQWCLGDVHSGNVLVKDNQITGIVDFGAATIDSVAGDIARLVGGLPCPSKSRQEYLRAYVKLRPLTNDEQRAISAYLTGGLICSIANWIRWLYIERSVPLANSTQVRIVELDSQFSQLEC